MIKLVAAHQASHISQRYYYIKTPTKNEEDKKETKCIYKSGKKRKALGRGGDKKVYRTILLILIKSSPLHVKSEKK